MKASFIPTTTGKKGKSGWIKAGEHPPVPTESGKNMQQASADGIRFSATGRSGDVGDIRCGVEEPG